MADVVRRGRPRRFSQWECEELNRVRQEEGLGIGRLAKALGVNKSQVERALRYYTPYKTKGPNNCASPHRTSVQ